MKKTKKEYNKMKIGKSKKVIFAAVVLLSGIIAIGSIGITEKGIKTQGGPKASYPMFEFLHGAMEFNLVPPGDRRVWHIESVYKPLHPGEEPQYNTSDYTFKRDSVQVVNKYAGMPNEDPLGIGLPHIFLNPIIVNN